MNLNYLLVFGIILFLRFYGENNDLYTALGLIVIFFVMRNITEGIVADVEESEGNSHTVHTYTNEDITNFLSPTQNNPSYGKITPAELLNSGTTGINGNIAKYTTALNSEFKGKNIRGIYSYILPSSPPSYPPSSQPSYPPISPDSLDLSELIRVIQDSRMISFDNNDFYKSYIIGIINKLKEDSTSDSGESTSDSGESIGDILIQSIGELDLEENFFRHLHHNINVRDVDRATKVGNVVVQLDDLFNRLFRIGTLKHAFDIIGFVELYIFFVLSIFSYYDNFYGPYPDSDQNIMEKYNDYLGGIVIDSTAFIMMKCGPGGSAESDRRCINFRRAARNNQHSPEMPGGVMVHSPDNTNSSPEEPTVSYVGLGAGPHETLEASQPDPNLTCAEYNHCPDGTKLKSSPGQIDQAGEPNTNCCEPTTVGSQCPSPLNYFADPSPKCICSPLPGYGWLDSEDRTNLKWMDPFDFFDEDTLCFEGFWWYLGPAIALLLLFGGWLLLGGRSSRSEMREVSMSKQTTGTGKGKGEGGNQSLSVSIGDVGGRTSTSKVGEQINSP
jgi:hypothetical protein